MNFAESLMARAGTLLVHKDVHLIALPNEFSPIGGKAGDGNRNPRSSASRRRDWQREFRVSLHELTPTHLPVDIHHQLTSYLRTAA
jgi:hypothetical protein